MEKKRSTRYDILLISALLCLSLIIGLVVFLTRREGAYVVIEINGKETAKYSLSIDGEYSINGGTNILVVKDGEAYLTYADCPDKTCVKTGKIKHVGESIICLPNRVAITIKGNTEDGVDIVS
ncbi:MAG: NusG domain II-containing protein [Ruminococcaceae bacterium]|nr:NusG domain II-containing protein [Oscillospiraceae bacterium]